MPRAVKWTHDFAGVVFRQSALTGTSVIISVSEFSSTEVDAREAVDWIYSFGRPIVYAAFLQTF